ncbi:hypothetical protein BX600DRAFT_84093 [Xylariales sp. PMI_506]|nr:hypothetical protein BX600DRAFT_84093 [Xylariales sp. PMI_506]
MRSLFTLPSAPLRRDLLWRHHASKIIRRYKFIGRPESLGKLKEESKSTLLPTTPARTRFAPSPTGYLHLGSLRTALFNYLLARATGGQFLLRLEDTDQARLVSDAEPRLYEDLKWVGLSWDEGPDKGGPLGPYKQSERLQIYNKYADGLINTGQAYRCFCKPEELDAIKLWNMNNSTEGSGHTHSHYNGKCRHIPAGESERRAANGEPHAVRLMTPSNARPSFNDLVYGTYKKAEPEDDFILIKRDGYPTYHFANVIDDHLMEITHVIRGAEWLTSTPRHVLLYEALGWSQPAFAHVGLLCNAQGQKLSKRAGDIDVSTFRANGLLPVALLNYSVLLGWSPGRGEKGTSEIMDLDDMISKFHLRFTKGNIRISNKQSFIQQKHMARLLTTQDPESFKFAFLPSILRAIADAQSDTTSASDLLPLAQPRAAEGETVADADYLFQAFKIEKTSSWDPATWVKRNAGLLWETPRSVFADALTQEMAGLESVSQRIPDAAGGETAYTETASSPAKLVRKFQSLLTSVPEDQWSAETLKEPVMTLIKSIYAQPTSGAAPTVWGYHVLRWILFALEPGPAVVPCLAVLGRQESLKRVALAKEIVEEWEQEANKST